jgi:tripartite-type tricarboxylate transporter receptor subunit TctC
MSNGLWAMGNAFCRAAGVILHPSSLILCAALAVSAAQAQQPAWPARVVRIIATSPPGGSIDFLARTLADDFGRTFGQPFIVENRPGANGNIGVDLVVKAPADGHMLFVTAPGPFSINAGLYDSMPFNPATDIAPIALLAVAPLVLVVHPSVPARNVKELVAFMRSQRGAVNYASQAVGSTGHLAMELFKSLARVEATHVPYRGSAAQATLDLITGRVAMGFVNTSTTLSQIRGGRLRAIAVAEKQRIASAPELPTIAESGYPGFEATPWLGLGTRSGTPREITGRLNEAATRVLARPESVGRMEKIGIEPRPMTVEQFTAFVRAETARWGDIIRRSGAKAD